MTLAQILRLVKNYPEVHMVAVGSYMCESYFSVLRYLSHGDNSASRAESIIINMEILDYCWHETGREISGNKKSRARTIVINAEKYSILKNYSK